MIPRSVVNYCETRGYTAPRLVASVGCYRALATDTKGNTVIVPSDVYRRAKDDSLPK